MATLGAELAEVAAGRVTILLPIVPRVSQQDGFLQAGVIVAGAANARTSSTNSGTSRNSSRFHPEIRPSSST